MNALIDVLLYLVIILGFGGAAMFFLHMIVRLITAIRECNRDLKEQEEKEKPPAAGTTERQEKTTT